MLTLSGVLMPEITGGRLSLLALEQMAEQGKAWPLIERQRHDLRHVCD